MTTNLLPTYLKQYTCMYLPAFSLIDMALPIHADLPTTISYGAFTLDVKSVLNENLGGILGGTQC